MNRVSVSANRISVFILMRASIQNAIDTCKYLYMNECVHIRYLMMKQNYNCIYNNDNNNFLFKIGVSEYIAKLNSRL